MFPIITIIVIVIVIALMASWVLRGRSRRPAAGPTMPDLSVAEEVQRIEQLHDDGTISDEEYRDAKSRLLS